MQKFHLSGLPLSFLPGKLGQPRFRAKAIVPAPVIFPKSYPFRY